MSKALTSLFVTGILSYGGIANAEAVDPTGQKMVKQTTILVCDKTGELSQVCSEPQARLIIVCTEVPEGNMGYATCPKEWERANNNYPIQAFVQDPKGGRRGAVVEIVGPVLVPIKEFTPHWLIKSVVKV